VTQPNSSESSVSKVKQKNRLTIIALLVIFAMPVVFAYSAFFFNWYEGHNTVNKGELIKPILPRTEFNLFAEDGSLIEQSEYISKWSLIYVNPGLVCDDVCAINLNLIRQVHVALGKEAIRRDDGRERLFRMLVMPMSSQIDVKAFTDITIVKSEIKNSKWQAADRQIDASYIYLADPLGNILMRYGPFKSAEGISVKGKDLVKDIKKLLKYSRLG
jgi:hypothetical protein